MHVPLVVVGPGVTAGTSDAPVSTRRAYHTILDFAGVDAALSLRAVEVGGRRSEEGTEVVLGEAMKPFLEYGWQPQVMAVGGRFKAILAGKVETYDIAADPAEGHDLGSGAALPAGVRKALEDYPVPSPATARAADSLDPLDKDAKRRLASLGYVSSSATPVVRKDAPRPADMTAMMEVIERASGLYEAGRYADCIPLYERVLAANPRNIDAALRLASAHSALGQNDKAIDMFQRAAAIDPNSQDVRTYLGLHYVRVRDWDRAAALLEQVVKESPDRATAVDALATVKGQQGARAMDAGKTDEAIADFDRARTLQPSAFGHDLELGVLYLAAHRFEDARAALDRFLAVHPDDPMALFKRAQVSVLLKEADAPQRIALARQKADGTTRPLVARERLFSGR
jgi:tetratricopeptide (TPR) repeat protein